MSTAALVVSAKSITTAIERLDVLLASRSDPDDQTLRALRDKIAAVCDAASVGTGLVDELDVLTKLGQLRDDWLAVDGPGPSGSIDESRKRHTIYIHLAEAQNPLKDVRDSYPVFDPPPEARDLGYWFGEPPT
jgi:hypothetical protein